mmetsp:Transcript_12152/g.35567  ORF Transcript_12152/g.35567 Transcript_12152/m.35567 type:complete len:122 (-) Transcript_12152:1899-2264(-)
MMDKLRTLQFSFYSALFIATLTTVSVTLARYPLFPLNTESLEWSNAWLSATVVDFYGACLCFCGVVISSERSWIAAVLWTLGFCLLGSPVCCAWVLIWLWKGGGTLRLERTQESFTEDRMD